MEIKVDLERLPREYYRQIADLSDQLLESGVPQQHVDRALDKIEAVILEAIDHAEEESEEDEESDDDEDDEEDSEKD